jgi:hypothetical protein
VKNYCDWHANCSTKGLIAAGGFPASAADLNAFFGQGAVMSTSIEVVGVYPVAAAKPCHLIELVVRNAQNALPLTEFTQEIAGVPEQDWQVPWQAQILDSTGSRVIAEGTALASETSWSGDVRLAFFFHNLDFSWPFLTPCGVTNLPLPEDLPVRLRMIGYKQAP